MMKFIRDLRLIPIAVVACACLLVLKAADLFLSSNATDAPQIEARAVRSAPDAPRPSSSMLSWASQMFNFPDGSGETAAPSSRGDRLAPSPRAAALPPLDRNLDITGSVPEPAEKTASNQPAANKAAPATPKEPPKQPAGTVVPLDNSAGQVSGAERAILERLQQRRQELDTRAKELDIRESLIKAAEKRIEGQLAELKETESRIQVETKKKDDAQAAQFKGLVTMYENMKPRDAAKIFDRLDAAVLLEVASKIEPRHMADIMAQMSPDAAQHLTVELANQAQQITPAAGAGPNDLPKIQGQPTQ